MSGMTMSKQQAGNVKDKKIKKKIKKSFDDLDDNDSDDNKEGWTMEQVLVSGGSPPPHQA